MFFFEISDIVCSAMDDNPAVFICAMLRNLVAMNFAVPSLLVRLPSHNCENEFRVKERRSWFEIGERLEYAKSHELVQESPSTAQVTFKAPDRVETAWPLTMNRAIQLKEMS